MQSPQENVSDTTGSTCFSFLFLTIFFKSVGAFLRVSIYGGPEERPGITNQNN